MYFSDFTWNDYCFQDRDPSVIAQRITEVIVSGMEAYIPRTFSTPHAKKLWFNHACSRVSKIERLLIKGTRAFKLPLIMIFLFPPRIVPNLFFDSPKITSTIESAKTLLFSNPSRDFWHLAKKISSNFTSSSFPPLLNPDGSTAVSSISKAELFSQTFSNNYTLDDSGHIPPTYHPTDSFMTVIKILPNDVFYVLSGLNPQKVFGPDGVPPIVLKNCASVLTPCLVKLFRLCLSTSTFPSCWKYAYVQPVPKKGDRSNPSNYCPIALLSCLSKAFESILNRKIQKHLSTPNLLSDRQYGFRKWRSTGDLLSLLTVSWSSCLSRFGEIFSVALDISKAFDRVWHKPLMSKLPSFGFYPSLCSFISSFLSGRSVSAVVDCYCSSHKTINSGVKQGSVLSPTLFLFFINDLLSVRNCPIYSYADDSTLHFSPSFDRRPTLQDLQDSILEAAERLTSDLALISDWGRRDLLSFKASKTQFLQLSTRHNLPNSYPLFFDSTQLSPSATLNILGLSFTQNLNWKIHISSLTKSASLKLDVLYRLRQFLSLAQLISIYRGLVRPHMEYASHVCGGSTHTALLDRLESKALRLISSSFTDNLLPLKFCKLPLSLSSIVIFTLTALLNSLIACLPLSCGLAAPAFALKLIPLLSKSLMLELTSIFTPSSLLLVNSGTLSLYLYFPLPMTWILSRGEC